MNEALLHAGIQNRVKVQIDYVNAEELESQDVNEVLKDADAILVPGGFGERGTEGKMKAIRFARIAIPGHLFRYAACSDRICT